MPLETGDDYYNYYSSMMPWGNQGSGTPDQGTGITQLATPTIKYPPQGGGGEGFNLPQNYYGIQGTNQGNNFLQSLNPAKQIFGAGLNKIKMGLGTGLNFIGGMLPAALTAAFTPNPAHASNQRWAVDGAGYGQGTQRDQFGMLVGQSLMDPSRTYGDRLGEREDELADIIKSQIARGTYKKTGWHQRQLDHINQVNETKKQEQEQRERDARKNLGTSRPTTPGGWHPGVGDSGPQGTDTPSGHAGDWGPGAARGGIMGAF